MNDKFSLVDRYDTGDEFIEALSERMKRGDINDADYALAYEFAVFFRDEAKFDLQDERGAFVAFWRFLSDEDFEALYKSFRGKRLFKK